MTSRIRRALTAAALVVAALAAAVVTTAPAGAVGATATDRLAGANRYATAAEVATATFPDGSDVVVLATGESFADALAASGVAGANGAPVLLTLRDDLPEVTATAIDTLGATDVVVMGGTAAVGTAVVDELEADGLTVRRIEGGDRFETAAAAAADVAATGDGIAATDDGVTAFLVNGTTFPDAVSASAAAYGGPFPVLLTLAGSLPEATATAIADNGIEHVILVGGTGVISQAVRDALEAEAIGVTTLRLAGADRFETNRAVADFSLANLGADPSAAFLSTGLAFADALVGGPAAGVGGNLLLLVTPTLLPDPATAVLTEQAGFTDAVTAIGGTGVVGDAVLQAAAEAAVLDDFQVLTVTPTGTVVTAPSSSPLTDEGARTYTASDLTAGTTYTIALLDPSVVGSLDGITRISAYTVSDDASSAIESVNGTPTMAGTAGSGLESVQVTGDADADGELTFTIDGAADDDVIPVVFQDLDDDGTLTLVGDKPDEPYGLGGLTTWDTP